MNPKKTFSAPRLICLLSLLLLTSAAVHAAGAAKATVYATFLSKKDRSNANGERLTTVADILRQDRANYHQGKGDRKDENDGGMFATKEGRAKFGQYAIVLENLKAADIVNGTYGSVVVRVVGQKIYVEGVE